MEKALRAHPLELSEAHRLLGFCGLAVGLFLVALDITIVAGSLGEIQAALSATVDEISWIQTSYLMGNVVATPLTAWLASVVSTRWLYVAASLAFSAASLACSMAWSIESMTVFRALQGLAGGPMVPLAFSVGFTLYPGARSATVVTVLGLTSVMAPAFGPVFGGWATQAWSWQVIFLVNLVPGIASALVVAAFVRVDRPNLSRLAGFDIRAIPLLGVALIGFVYVMEEGVQKDWFEDRSIALATVAGILAFVLVLWRSLRHPNPVVDLSILASRNFALALCLALLFGLGNYGLTFAIPVFLTSVRDYNSLDVGTVMSVFGAASIAATFIVPRLVRILPLRAVLALGLGLYGLSLILAMPITHEWGFDQFLATQVIRGFASILVIVPVTDFALKELPPARLNAASSLYDMAIIIGGTLGIAGVGILRQERFAYHYDHLAAVLTSSHGPTSEGLAVLTSHFATMLGDGSLARQAALAQLAALAEREATVMAIADILAVTASLFFAALLLLPFLRKLPTGR